jgi:signal transduction histidine kinase
MDGFQPASELNDLLSDPPRIPEREHVEGIVQQAIRMIPVTRLDLVTRVSHGIRTPLAAILGFQEILDRDTGIGEDERRQFAAIINTESNRLRRFIATLKTFDELRTSQIQLTRSHGDLGETVQSALTALASDAASKAIRIRITGDLFGVHLHADHERLRLVFEHLISNALKATPRGGYIELALESTDARVKLSITDTGPGLSSEDVERVFKPFKRLARPDDNGSELGLGLTLVRSIVELNGGSVVVTSLPTHGTCFAVELPR